MRLQINCSLLFLSTALVACPDQEAKPADAAAPKLARVRIKSIPAAAAVLEGEERLGKTPLPLSRPSGTLLKLMVVKEGYEPRKVTALFGGRGEREISVRLTPKRAVVIVRSGLVRGARIIVNGVDRGRTPAKVAMTEGAHELEVKKPGFQTYRETVEVKGQKGFRVEVPLLPTGVAAKKMGWLTLECDVPVLVEYQGKVIGSAPLERMPMVAKTHRFTLKSSILSASKTVEVKITAGSHTKRLVKLKTP